MRDNHETRASREIILLQTASENFRAVVVVSFQNSYLDKEDGNKYF